jgi:hypothetical protein
VLLSPEGSGVGVGVVVVVVVVVLVVLVVLEPDPDDDDPELDPPVPPVDPELVPPDPDPDELLPPDEAFGEGPVAACFAFPLPPGNGLRPCPVRCAAAGSPLRLTAGSAVICGAVIAAGGATEPVADLDLPDSSTGTATRAASNTSATGHSRFSRRSAMIGFRKLI